MSKQNRVLGRGELHFGRFKPGTETPAGERYFGNSPELTLSVATESIEHMDSDHGIKEIDESTIISVNYSGSFTTDNISADNVALFFSGEKGTLTQAAASNITETFADVEQGLTYQLGTSAASPTGVRNVASVVVKTGAVTHVAGTDYIADLELGRVTILEQGGIANLADITVTYDILASSRSLVLSSNAPIYGSMRFIAFNAVGEKADFFLPKVRIAPQGDYNLKGDEWQSIPFTFQVLKKPGLAAIYRDGRAYI